MRYKTLLAFLPLLLLTTHVHADDIDTDGVDDNLDNCLNLSNPAQRDTDWDGIGNMCDGDLNNNCVVNFVDLGILKGAFLSGDEHADLNGSGGVNFVDLGMLKSAFLMEPGPSGRSNLCTGGNCGVSRPPLFMRWVEPPRQGEAVMDSVQTTEVCPDGVLMEVVTQGLIPGHAYTMWFGYFENPDACLYPPRSPGWPDAADSLKCGTLDILVNTPSDGNFLYGDGLVATGTDDTFRAFIPTGKPPAVECEEGRPTPLHCANDHQVALAAWDDDPAILTAPVDAEFQAVLKSHGPMNEAQFGRDQIETVAGGCHPDEDYFPCRDPQTAGAVTDTALECFDDLACELSLVASVGYPFAAGIGSGPLTSAPDERVLLRISALGSDDILVPSDAKGTFTFVHTLASGAVAASFEGDIYCMSVTGATAMALGRITEGGDALSDDRIVFTLEDNSNGDVLRVNVPGGAGGVPIIGTCDEQVLDTGIHEVQIDEGHFLVTD